MYPDLFKKIMRQKMKNKEFVDLIKYVVRDAAIDDTLGNLKQAPKSSSDFERSRTKCFSELPMLEKKHIESIVKDAVNESLFGFLCVIDGVRAIEDDEIKGKLILTYEKSGTSFVLNNPSDIYLHDLYQE